MAKSLETKEKLFQTAVRLFAEDGFEGTTMRKIAQKAEMAPGAIYYYFESKESVVQEYYRRSHEDHIAVLQGYFDKEKRFEKRLQFLLRSKIEVAQPFKGMAQGLFSAAANPNSPLSPFSVESKELRDQAIDQFREMIETAKDKFHPEVKELVPKYLWLFEMGVILFWIHDRSKESANTFRLIDKTVPMLVGMNDMLNSTMGGFLRKRVINLLKDFEPTF